MRVEKGSLQTSYPMNMEFLSADSRWEGLKNEKCEDDVHTCKNKDNSSVAKTHLISERLMSLWVSWGQLGRHQSPAGGEEGRIS